MKVRIKSISNQGDYRDEYVTLEILEDCDIGMYLLTDSTYSESGTLSNRVRHVFWFPDKPVRKGDFVRLYTRSPNAGEKRTWTNKLDSTTHAFFWGLEVAVWNDEGDYGVLFDIREWKSKKVSEATK